MNSIKNLRPVKGRFEKIGKIRNNSKVILDYAHTPDALKTCLNNLKQQFENNLKNEKSVVSGYTLGTQLTHNKALATV